MECEIIEIDGLTAFERHSKIIELRNRAVITFLELGEHLYWFEKEKQYEDIGYKTFEVYLADPDIDISRTTAFKLKGVYETFILELKVPPAGLLPAGYDKLDTIRPYITEENADEWIYKAAALSRIDLRREVRESFVDIEVPKWDEDEEWGEVVRTVWKYFLEPLSQVRWRLEACQEFLKIVKEKESVKDEHKQG